MFSSVSLLNKIEWPQSPSVGGIYEIKTGKMFPASLRAMRHLGMLLLDLHEEDFALR